MVAKLYAACSIPHVRPDGGEGPTLAQDLGRCEPQSHIFNRGSAALMTCAFHATVRAGAALRRGLSVCATRMTGRPPGIKGIDWVQLTDDLSIWDRGEEHRRDRDVRDIWAEQYLECTK